MEADLVLPSLDAGDELLFRYVNRPHGEILFERMVNGLAGFTERFPGEVWLEVFLLGGVTGIRAEIEKIAALAERIRPTRIQLNTVSRPPAEEFAFAVAKDQMDRLAKLLPGMVEVISENEQTESTAVPAHETVDGDILAFLSRRPCTVNDLAQGLEMAPAEALKALDRLRRRGTVTVKNRGGNSFYCRANQP